MNNLLSFFNFAVTEDQTSLVTKISIAMLILLVLIVIAIAVKSGKGSMSSKSIAFAGVTIGASFVLSYLKIAPVPYGGSITLASMLPICIYAYFFGGLSGMLVGLIYGVLQFIQSPYILTPMTFVLDYLLAFSAVGAMGLFSTVQNKYTRTIFSVLAVFAIRFLFHTISGVIYFTNDAIWVDSPLIPTSNAIIYSLCYNAIYIIPDMLICLGAFLALQKTSVISQLKKFI